MSERTEGTHLQIRTGTFVPLVNNKFNKVVVDLQRSFLQADRDLTRDKEQVFGRERQADLLVSTQGEVDLPLRDLHRGRSNGGSGLRW